MLPAIGLSDLAMERPQSPLPKGLLAATIFLEFAAILGAGLTAGFFGFGVMIVVFHFLKSRTSVRRAWTGIAISLIPAIVLPIQIYARYQLQQRVAEQAARWEGVESPALSFVTLDGQKVELAQLRGKRVLLNFWATWCPSCQAEMPEIDGLVSASPDAKVAVFGISFEDEATVRDYEKKNPVRYPLVVASPQRLPEPFNEIQALPTSFVVDENGVIEAIRSGYLGSDELKALVWKAE